MEILGVLEQDDIDGIELILGFSDAVIKLYALL